MAREIKSRLQIVGTLVTETGLHVGGQGESPDTDLPLARNGRGEFYIPGTSIAGVIRSWCEKNFRDPKDARNINELVPELFGPKRTKDDAEGHASFVVVQDIHLPPHIQSEIRDGVGIDRVHGAAVERAKFDRAILPRGMGLNFNMTVEIGKKHSSKKTKVLTAYLLEALTKSKIRVGAAKTRGLGRVKLRDCRIKEQQLDERDSMIALLKEESRSEPLASWLTAFQQSVLQLNDEERADLNSLETRPASLAIKIRWTPKSPVMVKAAFDGIGVDTLPLTSGNGKDGKDQVSLVLPGSSIKGAFRAQAERIVRTVLDIDAPHNSNDLQNFSKQVRMFNKDGNEPAPNSKEREASHLIGMLFGAKKERLDNDQSTQDKKRNQRLGLGALSLDDCYAEPIDTNLWRDVERGEVKDDRTYSDETQSLWHALRKIDLNKKINEQLTSEEASEDTQRFKISHHVAIDRWTGGAANGALYSVLEPTAKIGWYDICMTLDLSRLRVDGNPDETLRNRSLMLLLLVLRDFAENRLPLGFATNRGMGEVVVHEIKGLDAIPKLLGIDGEFGAEIKDERLIFKGDEVKQKLKEVWIYE